MGKLLPLNIRIGERNATALCDFDSAMLLADAIDHSGCLKRDDVSRLVRVGYAYAALRRPALGSAEMEGWSALMAALAAVERTLAATEGLQP